jgi:hypothetical protein
MVTERYSGASNAVLEAVGDNSRPLCDIHRIIMGGRKLPFMGNRL